MNVLMLGLGKSSFRIRGHQLGAALGARVGSFPTPEDLTWADVVVLIKQAGPIWAEAVQAAKKPIVWDALDYWRQPDDNGWSAEEAKADLLRQVARIRPVLTIGATQAMADACGGVYLPHHARPGLVARPVNAEVKVVAYEGTRKYLGRWGKAFDQECARRGWEFVINPPDMSAADLIVACRDGAWDGWICQAWKSGVKLVNAIAAGRPVLTQWSAAYSEIEPLGPVVETTAEIADAFDRWTRADLRRDVAEQAATRRREFSLERVAEHYTDLLQQTLRRAA